MQCRLKNDEEYRETVKARARLRMKAKRKEASCPAYHTDSGIRPQKTSCWKNKRSAQQRYWTRRTRLTTARKQQRLLAQQKKMQVASSVCMLDVRLLFTRAEHCIRKASSKLQSLHIALSDKVNTCLVKLSTDNTPDEAQITAAFGGVRSHTSASEPYFSEQVYRRIAPEFPIPIDVLGRARLFMPYENPRETTQPTESDDGDKKYQRGCVTHIYVTSAMT